MFLSNELLHLVFADPTDEYFSDSLLKLDLQHYLWLELHRKYSAVYFLEAADRGFRVRTLGDRHAKPYVPNQNTLLRFFSGKTEVEDFGSWMLDQMTARKNRAAAFVCSAEDFCKVVRGGEWKKAIRMITEEKNRTGAFILTLPLNAEQSRELLLDYPAVGYFADKALDRARSGDLENSLLGPLFEAKGEACTVLAPYAGTSLRAILLRLQMEDPSRFVAAEELTRMQDYLRHYFHSFSLQASVHLLSHSDPVCYLSFHDLYLALKDRNVWDRLRNEAKDYTADPISDTESILSTELPPERDSAIGRCVRKLFSDIHRAGICTDAQALLLRNLMRSRSVKGNPSMLKALDAFLDQSHGIEAGDEQTYQKFLRAVRFCMDWLCIPENSEDEKRLLDLVHHLSVNIDLALRVARQTHELNRQRHIQASLSGNGKSIVQMRMDQLQIEVSRYQKAAWDYQTLLDSTMLDFSLSSLSRDLLEPISHLEKEISSMLRNTDQPELDESVNSQEEAPDKQIDSEMLKTTLDKTRHPPDEIILSDKLRERLYDIN